MNRDRSFSHITRLAVGSTLAALLLSACGTSVESKLNTEELTGAMGNATPVASPASNTPDGEVLELGEELAEIEVIGQTLAVRSQDGLKLGTLEEFRADDAASITLPSECGRVAASSGKFVLACGQSAYLIDPADTQLPAPIDLGGSYDLAVLSGDNKIIAASTQTNQAVVLSADGSDEAAKPFTVEGTTSQLALSTRPDGSDAVVRINREKTLIQDIELEELRAGAMLRVGLGVGEISAGEQGMFLAADTVGNQLAVYQSLDFIRLHQTTPVAEGPWSTAWDAQGQRALVASTGTNTLSSYRLNTGTPELDATWETIADAQHLAVVGNQVVLSSASGAGLQIIDL
ncbi:YncE family protein [Corynebacterium kozikiae]|uniref:YncE family protein n=1 Tax=Corynebacterium kozikiae TaxID=2968469 RepID=UPI00211CCCBC|nr:hypothetical protein [Corynebacterium sp. 76QC2CO]MCQ9342859.1 hypothetical protein [Corynebacterium sp. 76QC2CO]